MLVRLNIPKMAISQVRDILIQHFFFVELLFDVFFVGGAGWVEND
jgi:hypothetical protein